MKNILRRILSGVHGEMPVGVLVTALIVISLVIIILPLFSTLLFTMSKSVAITELEGNGYTVLAAGEYNSLLAELNAIKARTDNLPANPANEDTLIGIMANDTASFNVVGDDISVLEQKWDAKPRPYPYDTGTVLSTISNATVGNVFGNYVKIIPKGTYDFGDSPNKIQISGVSVESMSGNAMYVLEFSRGDSQIPIGALRFNRTNVQTRSFVYILDGRELNADTEDLWARVKSTPANATVTFSLLVKRHLSTSEHIPTSSGTFPFE